MAAHQAPLSLGFSRQEHWSGLPFPSPMHESEKWKGSRSVVSNSWRPHGLQPTRLLRPWDLPGITPVQTEKNGLMFLDQYTVNFCTMPTQHGTTGILFPKLTAQLKFPKIQIIYICIYIYRFIYLYKKTNSSMLCINSSNSFSKFCSHLNKIIETSSTLHLKKKK